MKRIFIFLFALTTLLAGSLPAEAQSLRDYIQSRAGGTDSLLIKAVSPSLSIVRQQYRLERGGEYFGKNNMSFYGESYTLAVKIQGATILQNQVLSPWSNDADYQRVNKTGKYTPVRFWSFQRSLNDSTYNPVEWELDSHYTRPLDKDSLLYKNEDNVRNFGLSTDESFGDKSGYMIWVHTATNLQDSTMHTIIKPVSHRIQASNGTKMVMNPSEPDRILGGVFVVPFFERYGIIRLALAGVASKSPEGEWVLQLLTKQEADTNIEKPDGDQRKKTIKKKQEEAPSDDEPTPVG